MFVGTSGITRVVKRTLEVMKALGNDDPAAVRNAGAIDLPTLQRYINFWFSSSLDLFGAEISSNAASYFASSLKGRPDEARFTDHLATEQSLRVELPDGQGGVTAEDVPMRSAINEVTRAAYIRDCGTGLGRWNRLIGEAGNDFRFNLPSPRFHRSLGVWAAPQTRGSTDQRRGVAPAAGRWVPSWPGIEIRQRLMQRHQPRWRGESPPDRHQQRAFRLRIYPPELIRCLATHSGRYRHS
jgi:benzoyl-CoA 2,3-dioxygenase component B